MIFRDLRTLAAAEFAKAVQSPSGGIVATAWQVAALPSSTRTALASRTIVILPDFLNYARLLSTGQAKQMLELAGGFGGAAKSGLAAAPAVLRQPHLAAKQDFWVVAQALTRYDFALLPRDDYAAVLLHSYLTDFACALNRGDFAERFSALAKVYANSGYTTQQLPAALTLLARSNVRPAMCTYLYSENDESSPRIIELARGSSALAQCRFVADLSSLPIVNQQNIVASDPGSWYIVAAEFSAP